jgi:uncharacterized protein YcfJ
MNNSSKRFLGAALALAGLACASVASADHSNGKHRHYVRHGYDYEYARVVDVDPIVRRVRISNPVQECWTEQAPVHRSSPIVARSTVVGGLIGAAAGHHLSHHHGGHDPALVIGGTVIGAAIGNSIGHDRAERRGDYSQVSYANVQRCQVNYRETWAERVEGYRVTYVYHGRHYATRMPFDPGRRVRINVDVRPGYDRD